jgi:hypothetical protein
MEAGVHGEHGVYVPRHVDHVAVHHLQRVVLIVKEKTMKRHRLLQPHVQVYFLPFVFITWVGGQHTIDRRWLDIPWVGGSISSRANVGKIYMYGHHEK